MCLQLLRHHHKHQQQLILLLTQTVKTDFQLVSYWTETFIALVNTTSMGWSIVKDIADYVITLKVGDT